MFEDIPQSKHCKIICGFQSSNGPLSLATCSNKLSDSGSIREAFSFWPNMNIKWPAPTSRVPRASQMESLIGWGIILGKIKSAWFLPRTNVKRHFRTLPCPTSNTRPILEFRQSKSRVARIAVLSCERNQQREWTGYPVSRSSPDRSPRRMHLWIELNSAQQRGRSKLPKNLAKLKAEGEF